MFENFMFSVNAIVPIFTLIAFGYYLRQKNVVNDTTIKQMNNVVFNYALPSMLFLNISASSVRDNFDVGFLAWIIFITIFTFLFAWGFAEVFIKDKSSIGAFVQGSFRGNYSLLGLTVISSILGDLDTGKGLLATTFVVPLYNVLSVIVLSVRNKKQSSDSKLVKEAIYEISRNPLIIGILLALPFSIFSINIPVFVSGSLDYVGSLAMPLALICIGANINFNQSGDDVKLALIASVLKGLIYPFFAILISVRAFNMRGEDLVIIFVMTSTPTAVSSYVMASNMQSNPKLASNIILFSTLISLFTFTFGIYILKALSFI